MDFPQSVTELGGAIRGKVETAQGRVKVLDRAALQGALTDKLAWSAAFAPDEAARLHARWLIRSAAFDLGIRSSSIHGLYLARGAGTIPASFTVPAINVRGPCYDVARAAIRAANRLRVGAVIFELARSETGYTDQRPGEYAAIVTAAAVREGFEGPLFLQGDHYQFSPSKYPKDPAGEVRAIRGLIAESLEAGYLNIDIDASTLVDLDQHGLRDQQRLNGRLTSETCDFIRSREPLGVTIGVGGEIGEVGKGNSRPEELDAFLGEFRASRKQASPGLDKISVNTGSSHGGVVGPDGNVVDVAIAFDALKALDEAARKHGAGGVVQHGASTLPEDLFHKFPEVGTLEIHLATGFQNLVFDHPRFPAELRERMVTWVKESCADERKPKDTEEQFLYKTRKKAYKPFKREIWSLPPETMDAIVKDVEARFALLMDKLQVRGTRDLAKTWAIVDNTPPTPPGANAPGALDKGMTGGEGE